MRDILQAHVQMPYALFGRSCEKKDLFLPKINRELYRIEPRMFGRENFALSSHPQMYDIITTSSLIIICEISNISESTDLLIYKSLAQVCRLDFSVGN